MIVANGRSWVVNVAQIVMDAGPETPECSVSQTTRRSVLWRSLSLLTCVMLVIVTGCTKPEPAGTVPSTTGSSSGPLDVVVTVGMVADLVRTVGGDQVTVTQLMGSGVDPHLYKATSDDIQRFMAADAIFVSGLMLEGRLEATLKKLSEKQLVVFITDQLPKELLHMPDEMAGHPDPHVWMDVSAWANCVPRITETLSKLRPEHAAEFQKRAEELQKKLRVLHEYGMSSIATIPKDQRVLVTSHDAFHYFGRAYGIEVIGVQGISTESEAGLQRINELVDLLVERKVTAVFVESSVPRENILALIDGAKARGHEVRVGGELYSDAMGAEGTWEGTYIGMLDHNITTVTKALGGTVPDGGVKTLLQSEAKAQ